MHMSVHVYVLILKWHNKSIVGCVFIVQRRSSDCLLKGNQKASYDIMVEWVKTEINDIRNTEEAEDDNPPLGYHTRPVGPRSVL